MRVADLPLLRHQNRHASETADTLRTHRQDHWHDEWRIGGGAVLVTLTLRRHAGMALAFPLVVLRYGWS